MRGWGARAAHVVSMLNVIGWLVMPAACGDSGVAPPAPGASASAPEATESTPVAVTSPSPPLVDLAPPDVSGELGADSPWLEIQARHLAADLTGDWRLEGSVRNVGGLTAQDARVTVRGYDSTGRLVDTRTSLMAPGSVAAGEVAAFGLLWPPDPPVARLVMQLSWVSVARPSP